MGNASEASCKLFVVLARQAPVGVIFRRGPSEWCQLIKWNTVDDTFEEGQWLHGKIYVRRCDLSPDGTKLLYFAAKYQGSSYDATYTHAWTAVSKPPWLTAIALWPKGDTWAGGGLFHDNSHIWLNHVPARAQAHPDHQPPPGLYVNPNPFASGEDYPLYANRLDRDGWRYRQHGSFVLRGGNWVTEQEEICVKTDPTRRFELQMTLTGIEPRTPGGSAVYNWLVRDLVNSATSVVPADQWADWDSLGRLVYGSDGGLFAGPVHPGAQIDTDKIADFTENKFADVKAPDSALVW
jgi:hypothetical protein